MTARLFLAALALSAFSIASRAGAQRVTADSLLEHGRAIFEARDYPGAADVFTRAIAADSTHASAWHWLGNAYVKQAISATLLRKPLLGRYARDAWERAAALDPNDILSRQYLASWYIAVPGIFGGDTDRAMTLANEISAVDEYRGAVVRGGLAKRTGDFDAAAEAYSAAMRLPGDSTGIAFERWLGTVERRRDRAAAVTELRTAMQLRPRDGRIRSALDRFMASSPR